VLRALLCASGVDNVLVHRVSLFANAVHYPPFFFLSRLRGCQTERTTMSRAKRICCHMPDVMKAWRARW